LSGNKEPFGQPAVSIIAGGVGGRQYRQEEFLEAKEKTKTPYWSP